MGISGLASKETLLNLKKMLERRLKEEPTNEWSGLWKKQLASVEKRLHDSEKNNPLSTLQDLIVTEFLGELEVTQKQLENNEITPLEAYNWVSNSRGTINRLFDQIELELAQKIEEVKA